jgi:hypothetical protein
MQPGVAIADEQRDTGRATRRERAMRKVALAIFVSCLLGAGGTYITFRIWRHGTIVAEAEFDPGIAPFTLTVRRVPVPVTASEHFIVELKRGEYVVTSFRYFWPEYTPEHVWISWHCIDHFEVHFDDHVATCDWKWGEGATWKMTGPTDQPAGLSPYFFTPRNPVPQGCQAAPP